MSFNILLYTFSSFLGLTGGCCDGVDGGPDAAAETTFVFPVVFYLLSREAISIESEINQYKEAKTKAM